MRLAAGGDPGSVSEGRPGGSAFDMLSHPFSPAEFLREWSAAGRPLPLAGWDRPSHALPERRLPAEHHMFLGTDMLLGVTPIASRYGVGQRPVVHRLQSLPRPLREEGRGLAAAASQAPPPRELGVMRVRAAGALCSGPLPPRGASFWGEGPRIRSRSGGLAVVGVRGGCGRGRYAVWGRAGLLTGLPTPTLLLTCLHALPSFIGPPHPSVHRRGDGRAGVARAHRAFGFFGANLQKVPRARIARNRRSMAAGVPPAVPHRPGRPCPRPGTAHAPRLTPPPGVATPLPSATFEHREASDRPGTGRVRRGAWLRSACACSGIYTTLRPVPCTYGHCQVKTASLVRSGQLKHLYAQLVLESVTI